MPFLKPGDGAALPGGSEICRRINNHCFLIETSSDGINQRVPAKPGMETKNIGDRQGGTSKQGTNKIIRRILCSEHDGSLSCRWEARWIVGRRTTTERGDQLRKFHLTVQELQLPLSSKHRGVPRYSQEIFFRKCPWHDCITVGMATHQPFPIPLPHPCSQHSLCEWDIFLPTPYCWETLRLSPRGGERQAAGGLRDDISFCITERTSLSAQALVLSSLACCDVRAWPLSIGATLQREKQGHHRDSDSGPDIAVLRSHLGTTCLVLKLAREWVFLWLKPLPAGPSVTCREMYPELITVSTGGCKTCTAYITRTWNWTGLIYRLMGILYLGSKGILLTESFCTITFWKKRSILQNWWVIMITNIIIINK